MLLIDVAKNLCTRVSRYSLIARPGAGIGITVIGASLLLPRPAGHVPSAHGDRIVKLGTLIARYRCCAGEP